MTPRGISRERQVRRRLELEGWWVGRCAGSLGDADLVALRADMPPQLIEVKATSAGPYSHFGPKARQELIDAAEIAGGDAVLIWWAPRGEYQVIPSEEWPKSN